VFWDLVPEGTRGGGVRVAYRQDAGSGFWGFGTTVNQNWTAADRLRFACKADPPATFRVELVENKQERWMAEAQAGREWATVELPFAGFQARPDFNPGERNGKLDLEMIASLVISTTTPGSGTVWIDELTVAGPGPR